MNYFIQLNRTDFDYEHTVIYFTKKSKFKYVCGATVPKHIRKDRFGLKIMSQLQM